MAGGLYASASRSVGYNDVQISIQTSSSLPCSYVVSAYNTTGLLVVYTQTNYPQPPSSSRPGFTCSQ